jgi:hypothetical protein
MSSGFGARLREAREAREIPLAAIAADTKIKITLLEALERDDVSQWPQGIFRRAYLRSYAQAIGLDPNTVLREFLELYPDPAEAAPEPHEEPKPQPMAGLRRLIDAAIGAVPARQQAERRQAPSTGELARLPLDIPVEVGERTANPAGIHQDARVPEPDPAPAPDTSTKSLPQQLTDPGFAVNLTEMAAVCTRLARASDSREVSAAFDAAAQMLGAVGIVVWSSDARGTALHPWLGGGYPDAFLGQLPVVPRDAENAIAAAFRTAETRVVAGDNGQTGAVVAPILARRGCVGVVALETRSGDERHEHVQAVATILAAQLVPLVGAEPLAEAVNA